MSMANVDLRKLHHALILEEAGGFTAASARLALTQSALSRSIQALEQQLGLTIFDRGRNGATPTMAGREFLDRARQVYGAIVHLERYAEDLSSGSDGEVTLGLGTAVSHAVLPSLVATIVRDYPRLSLTVKSEPAPALIDHLIDGRCDVVFVADTHLIDRSRVSDRPIISATAGVIARDGHPLCRKGDVTLDDLTSYTLVSGPVDTKEIRSVHGLDSRIIVCDSPGLLRDMVMTNDAIWLTLTFVAAEALKDGSLVKLTLLGPRVRSRFTIYELTMKQTRLSKSAEIISGIIEKTLEDLSSKL
jgi:DNA-binding transcriptional LysR family regulator